MTAEYLTPIELAEYASVSVRQLRKWTNLPPEVALPCYRFGTRGLRYKREEFDAWFRQYRTRGKKALVASLRALGLDPEHVPYTREPLARAALRPVPLARKTWK